MDENQKMDPQIPEEEGYSPRPAWQLWAARAGLVAFIIFVILSKST